MSALLIAFMLALAAEHGVTLEQTAKPEAYADCAKADIATSTVAFGAGIASEGNPLVRALSVKALGAVGGPVVAIGALSYGTYALLKHLDAPALTSVNTVGTCAVATSNLAVILGAIR